MGTTRPGEHDAAALVYLLKAQYWCLRVCLRVRFLRASFLVYACMHACAQHTGRAADIHAEGDARALRQHLPPTTQRAAPNASRREHGSRTAAAANIHALAIPYPTLPYPPLPPLPYRALPYPTLPYPTLPCANLPNPALPYPTLRYPTLPYTIALS